MRPKSVIATLLLLSLCACCLAQLPVVPLQTFRSVAVVIPGPDSISGLRYWWVASDNTTNITITNWVDRIVGSQLTNTSALGPTNSATGMGFDGSHYLKFKDLFDIIDTGHGATGTVLVIMNPITPASSFGPIISTDASGGTSGGYGFFTRSSGIYSYFAVAGSGSPGNLHSGSLVDMMAPVTAAAGDAIFYTNGISMATLTGVGESGKQIEVGADAVIGGSFYKGQIQEIIYYWGVKTSGDATTLHKYATNTYHYSP